MRKILTILAYLAVATVLFVLLMQTKAQASEYTEVYESMTADDRYNLEHILWAEANDQSFEGQVAVVEVIFNRVLSDKWAGTEGEAGSVTVALAEKGQFATWKSRNKAKPNEEQVEAVEYCERNGRTVLPSADYVFFSRKKQSWMHDCIKIGGHWFGK